MRPAISCIVATIVLLDAGIVKAQADWQPSPAPQISALADWQIQGDPVFYSGDFYDPTGPDVFFDGNVMVRTGVFRGVALYTDTTRQPFSMILVPVGRSLMRPYERRRADQPVGTAGGRVPFVPTDRDVEIPVAGEEPPAEVSVHEIESIPAPRSNDGIWIEFNGERWYSAGSAIVHSPDRFTRIGEYGDTPIFQMRGDAPDTIYVPAVPGGPLAPYKKR
jgi:hypothetical protein